jgi:acetoin utilization protein AcuB
MVVRDYMSSPVITIDPQCTIAGARTRLRKHRIRQLPVVHKDRLVGIITDRDLRSTSAATKTVGEVMTARPTVIRAMVPIDEAARVLRRLKVGALPVIDDHKLVGIITITDMLNAFVEFCGVTEPTYHLMLTGATGADVKWQVRRVIDRKRGDLKWIYRERRSGTLQVRLKATHLDDIVSALEAEGFEVSKMLSPRASRRSALGLGWDRKARSR